MKIGIVGLGHIGLPLSVFFASKNIDVMGFDKDHISYGSREVNPPFFERHLPKLFRKSIDSGFFTVLDDLNRLVNQSEMIFVVVSTPNKSDCAIDLSYLETACQDIAYASQYTDNTPLIVIKSTVLPGTTRRIKQIMRNVSSQNHLICINPEFSREGSCLDDLENPEFIIIGSDNRKDSSKLLHFYRSIYCDNLPQIIVTSTSNAEMIKYANNAFLATKISFINEIGNICSRITKCDIETVAYAIGLDRRIGPSYLKAGPPYGGSCLPKDLRALISFSKKIDYNPLLLTSVNNVNTNQIREIIRIIRHKYNDLKGKIVSILGLTFKKDTDDIRESPSLAVITALLNRHAVLKVHDPVALEGAKRIFGIKVSYCSSIKECISNSDCCVIMTDWDKYKHLTSIDFKKNMNNPVIVDVRRIFEAHQFDKQVTYYTIGRSLSINP